MYLTAHCFCCKTLRRRETRVLCSSVSRAKHLRWVKGADIIAPSCIRAECLHVQVEPSTPAAEIIDSAPVEERILLLRANDPLCQTR